MKTLLLSLVLVLMVYSEPVINPENVRPGDWFTPVVYVCDEEACVRVEYRNE